MVDKNCYNRRIVFKSKRYCIVGQMFFPDEVCQPLVERKGENQIKYCGTSRSVSYTGADYAYVRKVVDSWDSLRICAIAENGMCVAIHDTNAYAYQNNACKNGIDFAREKYGNITDLNVTKSGSSIVLFGNNGYSYDGCPDLFVKQLSKYNKDGEIIQSATFNDKGQFCIVTDLHCYYTKSLSDFMASANDKYGDCRYVFISELGRIAICDDGIYYENIPAVVEQKLGEIKFVPDYIKFTDTGYYCISNKNGAALYNFY